MSANQSAVDLGKVGHQHAAVLLGFGWSFRRKRGIDLLFLVRREFLWSLLRANDRRTEGCFDEGKKNSFHGFVSRKAAIS
jgi:hypothetical protein